MSRARSGRVGRGRRLGPGQGHGEGRAHAGRALERHRATELLGDAAHDVEPEPRAAVATRVRAVGLAEHLEDGLVVLGPDADARVLDVDDDPVVHDAAACPHVAARRELAGVADEVAHHQGDLARIGAHDHVGGGLDPLEGHRRRARQPRAARAELAPEPHERNRLETQLVALGLEPADLERALDELEQVAARRLDPLHAVGHRQRRVGERIARHVRVAQDHVERRAQLVRDGGDELALESARPLEVRDQARGAQREARLAREPLQEPPLGFPERRIRRSADPEDAERLAPVAQPRVEGMTDPVLAQRRRHGALRRVGGERDEPPLVDELRGPERLGHLDAHPRRIGPRTRDRRHTHRRPLRLAQRHEGPGDAEQPQRMPQDDADRVVRIGLVRQRAREREELLFLPRPLEHRPPAALEHGRPEHRERHETHGDHGGAHLEAGGDAADRPDVAADPVEARDRLRPGSPRKDQRREQRDHAEVERHQGRVLRKRTPVDRGRRRERQHEGKRHPHRVLGAEAHAAGGEAGERDHEHGENEAQPQGGARRLRADVGERHRHRDRQDEERGHADAGHEHRVAVRPVGGTPGGRLGHRPSQKQGPRHVACRSGDAGPWPSPAQK